VGSSHARFHDYSPLALAQAYDVGYLASLYSKKRPRDARPEAVSPYEPSGYQGLRAIGRLSLNPCRAVYRPGHDSPWALRARRVASLACNEG
jgi:hypothetical protein